MLQRAILMLVKEVSRDHWRDVTVRVTASAVEMYKGSVSCHYDPPTHYHRHYSSSGTWYMRSLQLTSRVDYCNSVLHRASAASVQPAAARIILRKRKFDHITTDVRNRLHWLPV